jgi:hypothetical protein
LSAILERYIALFQSTLRLAPASHGSWHMKVAFRYVEAPLCMGPRAVASYTDTLVLAARRPHRIHLRNLGRAVCGAVIGNALGFDPVVVLRHDLALYLLHLVVGGCDA